MERLTPLDATFLELEQADQSAHMHIGGVMLFEPRESGPPSPEEVARSLGARLVGLPRYRQRLSAAKTGGLHWPEWRAHSEFDPLDHIQRARLPGAGTDADLADWAAEYFSQRLDRKRPLWELVVLDGLEGGRWALVSKTHHCMVDGVGSVDAAAIMLDAEREPAERELPAAEETGGPVVARSDPPAPIRLAGRAARLPVRAAATGLGAASAAARTIRRGAGTVAHPDRAAEVLRRSRALADVIVRDELAAAPKTSLNEPIGAHRRLGLVEADLGEVKRIKGALGGTVNDVVLAAAAGALRRLLIERGEDPPGQGLRAMVPVNIRTAGEHLALGNKITSLFVHLPVAEADPARRYARQVTEAEALKSGTQALGASTIMDLAGIAPPVIHGFLARSLYATRLFNVTITNVPGPQLPLYAFGSKMIAVWPIVPLAAEHAVGIAIFSYDGKLFFCVNADRDTVPDLSVIVDGIAEGLDELSGLANDPDAFRRAAGHIESTSLATRVANTGLFI